MAVTEGVISNSIRYNPNKYSQIPSELCDKLSGNFVLLQNIDSNFEKSIEHIKKQDITGVSFVAHYVSRYDDLSLICISTSTCSFIFDIHYLNQEAFDSGLRDIFESKNIEKVIHDCRQPADALLHRFKTELVNVFDTQVADFIVRSQKFSGSMSHGVTSLNSCLENYLNVSKDYLLDRQHYEDGDIDKAYFALRPLEEDLRNFAIKNAIYLRILRQKLHHQMNGPYRVGVQYYLSVLVNLSDKELALKSPDDEMAPFPFQVMFENIALT